MKSAVTISLVPEALLGPFVFHGDLEKHCSIAADLGFDAVEIFPPDSSFDLGLLEASIRKFNLSVAAMGTGAGWIRHQWSLTSSDAEVRDQAKRFIRSIVDVAGQFGAPAIIGSMQGKIDATQSRQDAMGWMGDALSELADHAAAKHGTFLLYEPLNRYESNVFNRIGDAANWLLQGQSSRIRILADLFHMNIEESNLAAALSSTSELVGHIHFADSNRQAIGCGHTEMKPIMEALQEIHYQGYLSAEIFPRPDSLFAAKKSIDSFRECVEGL